MCPASWAKLLAGRLDLLAGNDLQAPVLSNHRTGQAVCDPIDVRHKALLPEYVWGDGKPTGVRQRAAEEEELKREQADAQQGVEVGRRRVVREIGKGAVDASLALAELKEGQRGHDDGDAAQAG